MTQENIHVTRGLMKKLLLTLLVLIATGLNFLSAQTSSFYTVQWKDGKAWFQSPEEKQMLSMGVNAIGDQSYRAPNQNYYNPVKNQYEGDKQAWVKNVFSRLKKWRFNTIGCWSDEDLLAKKFPYTYMLYIDRGNPWEKVLVSVFTDDFKKLVQENAQKAARYRDDPYLVGYFLDNELPWWGEYGWKQEGQETLLEKYGVIEIENENKIALKKFFEKRYNSDIDRFDKVWDLDLRSFDDLEGPVTFQVKTKVQKADAEAWAGAVAERFFQVTTQALREVDPNHLILGARFAGGTPWEVVEACGRYCDVVSVNHYAKSGDIDKTLLDNFYYKAQKPILITEYSFSSLENQSGDPNKHGADVTVSTQKERAEHFTRYATQALGLPYLVGLHWYEWADESPEGRFDGEDQNYGLVDIHGKDYALITQAHTKINQEAVSLHDKSAVPLPQEFVAPAEARYQTAKAGVKVADTRHYLKMDSTVQTYPWGDTATGGKMTPVVADEVLNLNFETGSGWGCGASFPSNIGPFVASGVVDLRGYNYFQFRAFVPKGLKFTIFMSESGNGDPSGTSFPGVNGADGESYSFPEFTGSGKWETYRVDLVNLERRLYWGNQHGNNILDLQALADVEFSLPGNQGAGKMLVSDLEFKVK